MELAEIKSDIQSTIEELSPGKLGIALKFLRELRESGVEETRLLLSIPGFIEDCWEAKEDIRTGNTISWESIKSREENFVRQVNEALWRSRCCV